MDTNGFFIADPFNDQHVKLFDEFEQKHKSSNKPVTTYLSGIKKAYDSKETYNQIDRNSNEINLFVFSTQKDLISDYCYIKGEKDRKICELFFPHLQKSNKHRKIMRKASKYALGIMGMEQVFVSLTPDDIDLYNQLCSNGYEDIGQVNGKTTLIKEKEFYIESNKTYS